MGRPARDAAAPQAVIDSALEAATDLADAARAYLASEEGRRLRRRAAGAVIAATPLLTQIPLLRRSPMGRLLGTAAVGTAIVKGAEWVRDWEPRPQPADPSD